MKERFKEPPVLENAEGKDRRVGFEFEYAGVALPACAGIIKDLLGGKVIEENECNLRVRGTRLGTFALELDARIVQNFVTALKDREIKAEEISPALPRLMRKTGKLAGDLAAQVAPFEIVTPPLTLGQLPELEKLRATLQEHHAQGTKAAFVNAFGMHINPDVPSLKVESLRDHLRAFLILYPWLKHMLGVDITRRMLTYIDPFPQRYVELVLAEDYAPTIDNFIQDYVTHNPTRNRALDMLPLFAFMTKDAIKDVQQVELVKPRPTFHYRLPNCEMDDTGWRVAQGWNSWVEVEQLAASKRQLRRMAGEYLSFLDGTFHMFSDAWEEYIYEQLDYKTG